MTQPHDAARDEPEDHDLGLAHDLPTLLNRRRALSLFGLGGAGLLGGAGVLAACGDADSAGTTSATSSAAGGPGGSAPPGGPGGGSGGNVQVAEGEIPEETNGPYPADGTNGVNVLTESGIVRSDIRSSFGDASGTAAGVPMTLRLRIMNMNGDPASGASASQQSIEPYVGAAVYVWHCDRDGNYSMYSDAIKDENYLRGVQVANAGGWVQFTSIFPACYSGRWPHVHFEVYPSQATATAATGRLRTSQLAFPKAVAETVYATSGYEKSLSNLAQVGLDSDNVFRDGYSLQLATVKGSVSDGYAVTLNVPV